MKIIDMKKEKKMKTMNCSICGVLVENVGEEVTSTKCSNCVQKELEESKAIGDFDDKNQLEGGDEMAKKEKKEKVKKEKMEKEAKEAKTTEKVAKTKPKSVIVKELAILGKSEQEIAEISKIPLGYVQAVIKKAKALGKLK